jgi:S-methylmethionine-dependent homocysteine/selenocysteine methylase
MAERVETGAARAEPADTALRERLRAGPPLVLDGALGTELERRGAPCELPLWSTHALLSDPALVERIHADYVEAGAEILTANTFRTQRRVLSRAGIGARARELTVLAVDLARRAARTAGRRVFVVGSAPTLEDCYRPDLVPEAAALAREHAEHAENLAAAGVDAVLIETINTIREGVAAARAARETGLPFLVSFVCQGRAGRGARPGSDEAALFGGEPLADALAAVAELAPCAVAVNCLPASAVGACLPALRETGLPFGVYANLGTPGGLTPPEPYAPDAFAEQAGLWLAAGARIVGGCCGTTPAHIRAITRLVAARG